MARSLTIALIYESREYLSNKYNAVDEGVLYHWREPEEIEAVTSTLNHLGHQADDIGPLERILEKLQQGYRPDLVWNLSVGVLSRNRTSIAAAVLEHFGVPYTGGDTALRSLLLNKFYLKPYLQSHAIETPLWIEINQTRDVPSSLPWESVIIKPSYEGFSIGVGLFFSSQASSHELRKFVETWLNIFPKGLIMEKFVRGREFTCSYIRDFDRTAVSEVLFPANTEIIDLEAKRGNRVNRKELAESDDLFAPIVQISGSVMALLPELDYASFDFRADAEGKLYLIDINPDATLHPKRAFVKSFHCSGVSYQSLIQAILEGQRLKWNLP